MYFKSIEIQNVGPIEHLKVDFTKVGDSPKPIIFVGKNGAGKSILLSHLVNSLTTGKQNFFDDVDVDVGKVYKYRSPNYIRSGANFYYSEVQFDSGVKVEECQLGVLKKHFVSDSEEITKKPIWQSINPDDSSAFQETFQTKPNEVSAMFTSNCCLYFPVNRFEEPAWLNIENLKSKPKFPDYKNLERISNREIITTSPLKNNKDWLLDIILDRQAFEINISTLNETLAAHMPTNNQLGSFGQLNVMHGYKGQSTNIYEAIIKVLKTILGSDDNIRLGIGNRKNRQISIVKDEMQWVPNLFQLSTGEVQLLNLFLSIIRDYDLSKGTFNNLSDIKGIVIIDEIDSHLHTFHQKEILPELIASFPNVQFIITTHSPFFLMGMEDKFGGDNFEIYNMPNGEPVVSKDFSEFKIAYDAFKKTTRHKEEIKAELEQHSKPLIFVEGDYDIRYINKASELLGKTEVLAQVQLKDGGGCGNLDKIWRSYDNPLASTISNKLVLIYDCDTKKTDAQNGRVYKRCIPTVKDNSITLGIENLFSDDTIKKVEGHNHKFIDIHEESKKIIRGVETITPRSKSVNKDEKGNMCNWLIANGVKKDFSKFGIVFKIIEDIINE